MIFETLSALIACHVTVIGEVVNTKSTIFEVLLSISRLVFDIFQEIFFGSMISPISCSRHQKFDYEFSSYPRNEA